MRGSEKYQYQMAERSLHSQQKYHCNLLEAVREEPPLAFRVLTQLHYHTPAIAGGHLVMQCLETTWRPLRRALVVLPEHTISTLFFPASCLALGSCPKSTPLRSETITSCMVMTLLVCVKRGLVLLSVQCKLHPAQQEVPATLSTSRTATTHSCTAPNCTRSRTAAMHGVFRFPTLHCRLLDNQVAHSERGWPGTGRLPGCSCTAPEIHLCVEFLTFQQWCLVSGSALCL